MNENDQVLIEAYLNGQLTTEQKLDFEKRCEEDQAFRNSFEEEKQIYLALNDREAYDFIVKTREVLIRNEVNRSILSGTKRISLFLAVCTVLVIAVYLFYSSPGSSAPQDLYRQFFEPYPMVLSERGPGENRFSALIGAYDRGAWTEVQSELEQVSGDDLPGALKDLYLSIALLGQGDGVRAEEILTKYLDSPADSIYQYTIEWYLALALLKNGKTETAKTLLEDLEDKVNSTKARERIKALLKAI